MGKEKKTIEKKPFRLRAMLLIRRLKNKLVHAPAGTFSGVIFRGPFIKLFMLYVCTVLLMSFLSAFLLFVVGGSWDNSEMKYLPSLSGSSGTSFLETAGQYILISVANQMIYSFSDISFRDWAKIVVIAQVFSALVINGLFLSLLVQNIMDRQQNIRIADKIFYDPKHHELVVWCWNKDIRPLYRFSNRLGIEVDTDAYETQARKIRFGLQVAKQQTYVESMGGFLVRSSSAGILNKSAPLILEHEKEDNKFLISATDKLGNIFAAVDNRVNATISHLFQPHNPF